MGGSSSSFLDDGSLFFCFPFCIAHLGNITLVAQYIYIRTVSSTYLLSILLTKSHLFYYYRSRNGKRYPFAFDLDFLERTNSIKTDSQTGRSISYKFLKLFRLNLPIQMSKSFHICK